MTYQVLIDGKWCDSSSTSSFQAEDPAAAAPIPEDYPVSNWSDCDAALNAAQRAFSELQKLPNTSIAEFLQVYADRIEASSEQIREMAARETALPFDTRLVGELARIRDGSANQKLVSSHYRFSSQHSILLFVDRTGGGIRAEQFSFSVRKCVRRRFCRRDRCRQSGNR